MKKQTGFQFLPSEWLASPVTAMMSPAEEGAYIRLLCYDWVNDGIPNDDEQLARLSRLGDAWNRTSSNPIKACFKEHPKKPGFLTNDRLLSERARQAEWAKKSSKGGRKSAIKRWGFGTPKPAAVRETPPKAEAAPKVRNIVYLLDCDRTDTEGIRRRTAHLLSHPSCLDCEPFFVKWWDWCQYYQTKVGPMTEVVAHRHIKFLEGGGFAKAIETIDRGIEGGWRGFYPDEHGPSPAVLTVAEAPSKLSHAEQLEALKTELAELDAALRQHPANPERGVSAENATAEQLADFKTLALQRSQLQRKYADLELIVKHMRIATKVSSTK